MALGKCLECGLEVSTSARKCPRCGKTNPTLTGGQRVAVGIFVALVMVGVPYWLWRAVVSPSASAPPAPVAAAAQAQQAPPTSPPPHPPPEAPVYIVNARIMWEEYAENEVAADARYRDRRLAVTGVVATVQRNALDQAMVYFHSPNRYLRTMAILRDAEIQRAAALRSGQELTLYCTGTGKLLGRPTLGDCSFGR